MILEDTLGILEDSEEDFEDSYDSDDDPEYKPDDLVDDAEDNFNINKNQLTEECLKQEEPMLLPESMQIKKKARFAEPPSPSEIHDLFNDLKNPKFSDDELYEKIRCIKDNFQEAQAHFKYKSLADKLVNCECLERSEEVFTYFAKLIVAMNAAIPAFREYLVAAIVKSFESTKISDKKNDNIHELLWSILPQEHNVEKHLLPQVNEKYPYFTKNLTVHQNYQDNVLKIIKNSDSKLKQKFLCSLMYRLIDFELEYVEPDAESKGENLLELIKDIYSFINYEIGLEDETPELQPESVMKLYIILLEVFNDKIIFSNRLEQIPFIFFYLCNFSADVMEHFLDNLWDIVKDEKNALIKRQNACCYLASFMVHANFIPPNLIAYCVEIMGFWLHSYLDNVGYLNSPIDNKKHILFYTVCHSLFFIFAHRHKEHSLIEVFKSIDIDRAMLSKLAPISLLDRALVSQVNYLTSDLPLYYKRKGFCKSQENISYSASKRKEIEECKAEIFEDIFNKEPSQAAIRNLYTKVEPLPLIEETD